MGDLARHLVVSVPYISDVERGYRPPLTEERIRDVAQLLSTDPKPLLEAAAECRSQFRLDATAVSSMARQVGAALERRWEDLSEDELRKIERIIEGSEKRQR
jgi:transcriptional regulator with XRE-family HTH domain